MLRNVFLKTLRDQRRSLLFWSIAMIALSLYIAFFYPMVKTMPGLDEMMKQIPEGLLESLLGGEVYDFTTPIGYLNTELFSFMMPLLFLVFAIGFASGTIAGEEEKGTLDFLLANPVSRRRVLVEKTAVMVVSSLIVAFVFWVGLVIGVRVIDAEVGVLRLAEAVLSLVLLGLCFGTLALALGCLTGSRGTSIGVSAGLAVITYFLNSLGGVVEVLEDFRFLSPFYHYIAPNVLQNGLDAGHTLVLAGLAVVFFVVSLFAFERRDLAV